MVSPSRMQKVVNKRTRLKERVTGQNEGGNDPIKPFLNKHFFIDVKNQQEGATLTKELKHLGAVIEDFVSKDVHVIISDRAPRERERALVRKQHSLRPNRLCSWDKRRSKNHSDTIFRGALRNRRGASDVLVIAERFGLEVWTLDKAVQQVSQVQVRTLTSPFIKIEDCQNQLKPIVKEAMHWPVLSLRSSGGSPFVYSKHKASLTSLHVPVQKGYCELCGIKYQDIAEHVCCRSHNQVTKQYENLDSILKTGPCESKVELVNGTCSDILYNGKKEEGKRNRKLLVETPSVLHGEDEDDVDDTSPKPRRQSCERKFLSDNQEYYKFEILSSKLRSTHRLQRENSTESYGNSLGPQVNSMHFSFERLPVTEPWFQTYDRQDRGQEENEHCDNSFLPFLLPYQMDNLDAPPEERRRKNHLLSRKSPRCHASTLALLLELSHKTPDQSTVADWDFEAYMEGQDVDKQEVTAYAQDLWLTFPPSDIGVFCSDPDIISLMQTVEDCPCVIGDSEASSVCDADSIRPTLRRSKKRKHNRTGWPRDKPRLKRTNTPPPPSCPQSSVSNLTRPHLPRQAKSNK